MYRGGSVRREPGSQEVGSPCYLFEAAQASSLTVRQVLRDLEMQIVEVRVADRLLRALRRRGPALVVLVLDSIAPEHLDLVRKVRERTRAPIVIISEASPPEMRIAVFEAGADEHVAPSVGRQELAARINAKLRRGTTV